MTRVRLLDHSRFPVETLYCMWEVSRHNGPVPTPQELHDQIWNHGDAKLHDKVYETFFAILNNGIPLCEAVYFTFEIEEMPISLREQMVRHRIGHKFGDRLGADIIPEIQGSTWWVQGTRILDLGEFFDKGTYFVPESIEKNPAAFLVFKDALKTLQETYQFLTKKCGVPLEDARQIIPLCLTHRLTWTVNLAALAHVLRKRSCWIAQLGMWKPVILGIVQELVKVDEGFRDLVAPPCVKQGKFTECLYHMENEGRITGFDPLPPCALWITKHPERTFTALEKDRTFSSQEKKATDPWVARDLVGPYPATCAQGAAFQKMKVEYTDLWGFPAHEGPREGGK